MVRLRSRLRVASETGSPTGWPSRREQHRRQLGVDDLVAPHPPVAEVEERLPVDETPRRSVPAAQVGGIGPGGQRGVEDEGEELLRHVGGARAEVGAVAGADLGVAEAEGGHRELDGDERVVAPVKVLQPVLEDRRRHVVADGVGEELVEHQPLVVPPHHPLRFGEQSPGRCTVVPSSARTSATTRLWKRVRARWNWETMRFSSLRGSPMRATPWLLRGWSKRSAPSIDTAPEPGIVLHQQRRPASVDVLVEQVR